MPWTLLPPRPLRSAGAVFEGDADCRKAVADGVGRGEILVLPGGLAELDEHLYDGVEGARAAGIRAILVARGRGAPAGVEAIGSLAELPSLL